LHCDDDDDDDDDDVAFTRIIGILLRWLVEMNPWPRLNITVRNEYAYNVRKKSALGVSHI